MNSRQTILASFLAASAALFGIAPTQSLAQGSAHAHPQAQGAGQGCDGPGAMRNAMMGRGDSTAMIQMMGQRAEKRLEVLYKELKITEQQQPLWQAYAEKVKAEAGNSMTAMRDTPPTGGGAISAPERLERMQSIMKARVASMENVHESFKRLYAHLSPEQKSAADALFAGKGPRAQGDQRGGQQGGQRGSMHHGQPPVTKTPESAKG